MADALYENCPVTVRKTAQGDLYEVGAVAGGVFVSLGSIKAPEFEARAAEAAANQQQEQPQEQPQEQTTTGGDGQTASSE